jgi:acyl-coenzyme A thioesterase PaaI-like protein
MNSKKRALEFKVYPLWDFLQNTYGSEEAFRLFGPYKGASISPKVVDKNTVEVSMPLVVSNTNYVGTHFGGSLYSMCDPFYMFILLWQLGDGYMVWDKSASIEFLKPGRGTVKVVFHIPDTELDEVRQLLETQKKTTRTYQTEIIDDDGTIVCKVKKELYIRKL